MSKRDILAAAVGWIAIFACLIGLPLVGRKLGRFDHHTGESNPMEDEYRETQTFGRPR